MYFILCVVLGLGLTGSLLMVPITIVALLPYVIHGITTPGRTIISTKHFEVTEGHATVIYSFSLMCTFCALSVLMIYGLSYLSLNIPSPDDFFVSAACNELRELLSHQKISLWITTFGGAFSISNVVFWKRKLERNDTRCEA